MKDPIMIKDLKKLAVDTEISGVPLLIKTARPTFWDAEENGWQEVVFMDSTGELTGHILLEPHEPEYESHKTKNVPPSIYLSKQRICIMKATMQETDIRRKEGMKVVITECFDLAVRLSYSQREEMQEEDWQQVRQDEIKGKIRHGLVCSLIKAKEVALEPIAEDSKKLIKDMVDFIMTGE